LQVAAKLDGYVAEPGAALVSAPVLNGVLNGLGHVGVKLHYSGEGRLDIQAQGRRRFQIPARPPTLSPLAASADAREMTIPAATIRKHLGPVVTDHAREGVLFATTGDELVTAATNGITLAAVSSALAGYAVEAVLPVATAREIHALTRPGDVHLAFDDSLIVVTSDRRSIASSLRREPFPPWRTVIPPFSGRAVEIEREEFIAVLQRLQAAAARHLAPTAVVIGRDGYVEVRLANEPATAVDRLAAPLVAVARMVLPIPRILAVIEPLKIDRLLLDQARPGATIRISSPDDPGLTAISAAIAEPVELAEQLAEIAA
jgi:DNA polymerase III sliding clamp (beta) subunit (PCNA family)